MRTILFLILILFFSAPSTAQYEKIHPKSSLFLNVDFSQFRLPPDVGFIEIYYAAYSSNITLEKVRDTIRGSVVFKTRIINTQNDSLVVHSLAAIPVIITDTVTDFSMAGNIGKSIFQLPFGSYELQIFGYDALNPTRKDSIYRKFTIEKPTGLPVISDIDLSTRIVQSDDKDDPFYKNSYRITPTPSLLFGGKIAPVVFSYVELYDLKTDFTYSIATGIMDARGEYIKHRKQLRKFKSRNIVDVATTNINTIQSGRYRFVVVLADTLGNEIARSEKPIFIYNPDIEPQALSAISPHIADYTGLTDKEIINEFRSARYVASDKAIKTFEKITTPEARREFIAKFWAEVESGQYGRNDITRAIYLDRVAIANQRYRAMGREGWQTDRGRVFILYGQPDDIQRFPSSENVKPYEIWEYNQIESGVVFVFVDRTGLGEYILVHSTKRGEMRDESWERHLR